MMQAFQANLCSRAADLVSSKCLTSAQEAGPSQQLLRNQEAWLGTRAASRCQLTPLLPGLLRTVVVLSRQQKKSTQQGSSWD